MKLWQKLTCSLFAISVALGNTAVHADFIVSMDLDSASGIQSTNAVPININDEITASIFMEMTSPSSLVAYQFSIRFGSGLEYINRTELDFGTLVGDQDTNNNSVQNGVASGFDAGFLGAGSFSTPTGPISIGSVKFKVIGSSGLTIEPGLFDGGVFDMFVDDSSNAVPDAQITFNSGVVNITSVPEPSSLLLLAVGTLGLLGRRRLGEYCSGNRQGFRA